MAWNGLLAGQCAFSFVYAASFIDQRYVAALSTAYMALDGLTVGVQALYFGLVNEYLWFYTGVVFEVLVAGVLASFILLENPSFLLDQGRTDEAK